MPERQHGRESRSRADALFPIAMRLQIDVSEHGVCVTARLQLTQRGGEYALVICPTRFANHELEPQSARLAGQQRSRQSMRAAARPTFLEHDKQSSNVESELLRTPKRETGIFAAAEGAEREHVLGYRLRATGYSQRKVSVAD